MSLLIRSARCSLIRLVVIGLAAWMPGAGAACLPLPSAQLEALDRTANRDPEAAVREAQSRIEALRTNPDPLLEAQYYAVISQARFEQSRADATLAAAAKAESLLAGLPPSADVERVRMRVQMNVADSSESPETFEAAVQAMSGLIATTGVRSAEHSCALSIRGQAHSELGALALAASDAFEAYRIAEAGHWPDARITAAYVLATIYRRSGLLTEASRMIDEVVAFATEDRRTPLLSGAAYVRGQVLIDMHRFNEARSALELSRSAAVRTGDRFGAVTARVPLCLALISEGDFIAAEKTCYRGDEEFRAAGADEFLSLLISYRARIDLVRNRPEAAIAKLDTVLSPSGAGRLVRVRAQVLRDRARAYQMLGRYREAYRDLQESIDVEIRASTEQQALTVAVLSATAASDRLIASNHMLAERMARQQEEIAHRKANQELWFVLALAAVLLSILFGYLLAVTRRHERAVGHQELIMRTLASNAPDAMMLLNLDRTVQFANRRLLGSGPTPEPGTSLADALPSEVYPSIDAAVDRLVADREPFSFPVSIHDEHHRLRHFEMRAAPVVAAAKLIGVTIRASDVTEFRRLESEVIDVASRERQRLSSDLHEGLGQELTGISLLLASLATAIERGNHGVSELVEEVRDVVARCIDMTRELARGLSPVQIERGSLGNALGRLAADASRRLRIRIAAHSTAADVAVSDVAADHLYRIAYEALTNAARHSGCENVAIELWVEAGILNLSVSDDGSGLRARDPESTGLGLDMIRYRVRLLGGTLELGPGPDGGTQVLVSVPLSSVSGTHSDGQSAPAKQQDDHAEQDDGRG